MTTSSPDLLLIDAGNTRIKWACVRQSSFVSDVDLCLPVVWDAVGSLAHADLQDLDQHLVQFALTSCLISNVAGDALQAAIEQKLLSKFPQLAIQRFKAQSSCTGLHNDYLEPERLGADRFASALAAHHLFPDHALVVATCGTATTVDAVTPDHHFAGGMILPGLQLMASSLGKNTAQLPQSAQLAQHAAALQNDRVFANNTDHAIVSGCIHAQVGAIVMALDNLQTQSTSPVQLVISGGAAPYLLPALSKHVKQRVSCTLHHIDNLVLTGLLVVARWHFLTKHAQPEQT